MTPETQEQVEVGTAPENVVPIKRTMQEKFANKRELKAKKARDERREFLKKKGVPEEVIEQVLEQEAYNKLPIDQKVARLEQSVGQLQGFLAHALRQLSDEMVALRENQEEIADSFDINFKMLEEILVSLGITEEQQKDILTRTRTAFFEEKVRILDEKKKAAEAAKSSNPEHVHGPNCKHDDEQARIEAEVMSKPSPVIVA